MSSEVKVTVVPYEEYTDIEFLDPATFYFKDALGNRHYIHTSKRNIAQQVADEFTGVKDKYKVIASKDQKNRSKLESGEVSVRGTHCRKGQKKH